MKAFDNGDFDLAISCYSEAIRLNPKYAEAFVNRGRSYTKKGDMIGDEKSVELVAAMEAGSREAHSLIAQATMADPKTKAALDAAKSLDAIERQLAAQGQVISNYSRR